MVCNARLQQACGDPQAALNLLHNVAFVLRDQGFFFGFTVDSGAIWSAANTCRLSLEALSVTNCVSLV